MFELNNNSRLDVITDALLHEKGITLSLKRDDLLHDQISGNKWRKLKYNLIEARNKGYDQILTFGGAYSNHIAATAAACKEYGFRSIGIIRGDELNEQSNETLKRAASFGMKLKFVSRSDYRKKNDVDFVNQLIHEFGECYVIPEGGANSLALKGCGEILEEIDQEFDFIVTAVGTGGTLAGLAGHIKENQYIIGIPVLKNAMYLSDEISELLSAYNSSSDQWELNHEYHLGGYAKFNVGLIEFINQFNANHGILLDPIYTGKMMYALFDLIKKSKFKPGSRIIALHTGGVQGIVGFNATHGDLIKV